MLISIMLSFVSPKYWRLGKFALANFTILSHEKI
jgi:hypothetical protein